MKRPAFFLCHKFSSPPLAPNVPETRLHVTTERVPARRPAEGPTGPLPLQVPGS